MGRQLALGHSSWWFDMWGKFYDTPAMMEDMRYFRELVSESLTDSERGGVAECAAWIDEEAFGRLGSGRDKVCREGRFAICQCGVPFDLYELGDWEKQFANYRAAVFFAPDETPRLTEVLDECEKRKLPHLVMRPGAVPAAAAIRELAVRSGAHCYCDSGDAVWIGSHYAAIHAASAGEKILKLPRCRTLKPLFPAGVTFAAAAVTVEMQLGETNLWRLD